MHAYRLSLAPGTSVALLIGCAERPAFTGPHGLAVQEVFSTSAPAPSYSTSAAPSGPYVVVDIVSFIGPDCSAAVVRMTNQGDAEQPFGWTLTLQVKKLNISQTFFGLQPLAAGETRETVIGTGITTPGTYSVRISPGEVSGKAKSGSAILRLPATC